MSDRKHEAQQHKFGDKVLSKNDKTGEKGYKSVVRLFRGHTDRVVTLRLTASTKISKHRQRGRSQRGPASRRSSYAKASSGSSDSDSSGSSDSDPDSDGSDSKPDQAKTQEIRCTTEHPFWVVGRGWVPAGELRDGDELVGEHEESLFVESARIDKEEADHYNFEVEDWHSYFVGEDADGLGQAVWVHNDCEFVTLYHGTNEEGALSILKNGVSGHFSRRNQDFGSGFYMTTDLKQAETRANQFKNGIVLEFNIPRATYDQFNIRVFDEQSIDAWREFTGAHRRGTASTDYFYHMEEDWTRYDGFSGPMVRNPIQVEKEFAIPVPIGQQTHFRSPDVLKLLGCYLNTESAAVKRLRGL